MSATDNFRTITGVATLGPASLRLSWSDGTEADLDLSAIAEQRAFMALRDPDEFAKVTIGEWGNNLEWPSGAELSAESLWLDTLSRTGHEDARTFLEWRLRNGLSLSRAAEALGISRRMVAYYSNGDKKVPKPILLACRGWEVSEGLHQAA